MIYKFEKFNPKISKGSYIHNSAQIIGKVKIEKKVSIWPNVVIRGDVDEIVIKEGTNVQDNSVLHPNKNRPVIVGKGVTIGHSAIIHGSKIGKNCLIGMGAIVMDSEIGEYSIIGAGCLITQNSKIPPYSLVMGLPYKIIRKLKKEEIKYLKKSESTYIKLAQKFQLENF